MQETVVEERWRRQDERCHALWVGRDCPGSPRVHDDMTGCLTSKHTSTVAKV
jgi:hypothetical protein